MAEPLRSWRQRRGSEVRHEHTREIVKHEHVPGEIIEAIETIGLAVADINRRLHDQEGAHVDLVKALRTVGQIADELQKRGRS